MSTKSASKLYQLSREIIAVPIAQESIAVSQFEYMLLNRKPAYMAFRLVLFEFLDVGVILHCLRSTSKVLRDLVDQSPGRLFRQLYMGAPLAAHEETTSLDNIAPFCCNLTIKVGYDTAQPEKLRHSIESVLSIESPRRSKDLKQSFWEKPSLARTRSILKARSNSVLSLRKSSSSIKSPTTSIRASAPSSQMPLSERRQQDDAIELWTDIISQFRQLRTLTLRINGDSGWPGRTEIESTLITLRVALERADPPHLHSVSLAPVHAMGIIHLRWSGLGTFGPSVTPQASVWQRIEILDLRIQSPFAPGKVSEGQQKMFKQVFHNYLESFAPTLKCLRVIWLDGDGPSPLALPLEPGLEDRRIIEWPCLEELWVGNITRQHHTITLTRDCAPLVTTLKMLRSTRRESFADTSDSSAWVDVQLTNRASMDSPGWERGSSLYSQNTAKSASTWEGGISRSSREVPFVLDL